MLKKATLILLFVFCCSTQAQTIQGTVLDSLETVPYVNVLIKKIKTPNLVFQFTTTNEAGFYQLQLKEPLDSVYIEVTSMLYEPQQLLLTNLQSKKSPVIQDFKLHERTTLLKEVVIEKVLAIRERNDTVTYNPEAFKDGSERVIEDLLKKLPGIKVEESGEIKYKGKSISNFLLDGDNLFDSQYTIGSRNIDVDMVENVQAIENYNENTLLKGLINSDEVAINLQLKKGITDFSGNAKVGYGIKDKYNFSTTGMLINQKSKSFVVASYNNIGNNNSPYDFRSGITSVEMLSEDKLLAKELIHQGGFYSQIQDKYHRFNDNWYISSNFLHKVSKRFTVKTRLAFYHDKLTRLNNSHSEYTIGDDFFTITEVENISKKPRLYNANIFAEHKATDSLTWEYLGKLNYQEVDFQSFSTNNNLAQNNQVETTNFLTKHNFNLTYRIDEKSAFLTNAVYTKSRAPQFFSLAPGLNINEEFPGSILQNNQDSRFDKETFKLRLDYYRSFGNLKWRIVGDYTGIANDLNSVLTAIQDDNSTYTSEEYQNNLKYGYKLPSLFTSLSYMYQKKYGFGLSLQGQYYDFLLEDKIRNTRLDEQNFVLSSTVKALYNFNRKSGIMASYSYSEIAPQENNLFEGVVLTGFRNFRNNEADFKFLKTHSYDLSYNYHDFFTLTTFSAGLNHSYRKNNFFSRTLINAENTISTSFLLPTGNKDYGLFVNAEQYIHFLRTTFQLNGNYNLSFDKNIVNDSDLRDIQMRNLFVSLTLRPGLKGKFGLENTTSFSNSEYFLEETLQNTFSSLTNNFKLIYKMGERLRANTVFSFVAPDLDSTNNYWFWDTEIYWTSKNKKFDYSIIARNLTNNTRFETISISDYSKRISSHNLIERFVIGSISFRF